MPRVPTKMDGIWHIGAEDGLDLKYDNFYSDPLERETYDNGYQVGSTSDTDEDPLWEKRALGETARD